MQPFAKIILDTGYAALAVCIYLHFLICMLLWTNNTSFVHITYSLLSHLSAFTTATSQLDTHMAKTVICLR